MILSDISAAFAKQFIEDGVEVHATAQINNKEEFSDDSPADGIVNGVTETEFSPNENITREQIVAIMHRYEIYKKNDTETFETANIDNFDDAEDVSDYAKMSVKWAKKNGMMEHYALYPNYSCNRMTSVYYIWCAAGSPECKTPLKFADTQEQKYEKYYEAIVWAVENGITYGTSETTFGPGKSCTRAEIVTFLWRAASKGVI